MKKNEFDSLGHGYLAPGNTLLYAISPRLGRHIAERFRGSVILECCTGAGFLTIELAKTARHVVTIEIEDSYLRAAQHNTRLAGVKNVTFIHGDVLDPQTLSKIPKVDAAILDPVWGTTLGEMSPPPDQLIRLVQAHTRNIALILPPTADKNAIDLFSPEEIERLYLDDNLALVVLYKGKLAQQSQSEFMG
jgi:16S rRNA G966 N2-methylase RsmD